MSSVATVCLPQVAQITMGQSPSGDTYNDKGDGLPFFQGKAEFGEVSPSVRKWCNQPKKVAEAGDILISVRAPVGPTNLADVKCCIGRGLAGIRANRALVLPEYLRFALRHSEPFLASMGQGSTFAAIGRAELEKVRFPLPSLPEQQRIVDILSRAESIVRLRREAQQKAAELVPAIFLDMFGDPATNPKGWPVAALGELLDSADYGTSCKSSDDSSGVPVIRMGNVSYAGDLNLADLKYLGREDAEVGKYGLQAGDILFNRTNSKDLVGKTGIWSGELEAVAASYFIRLRVSRAQLHPTYLWALMNSRHMKKVLFETARGAIGQANINSKELRAFSIGVPPLLLQQSFAVRLRGVFSIRKQQAEAYQRANQAFDTILHSQFESLVS